MVIFYFLAKTSKSTDFPENEVLRPKNQEVVYPHESLSAAPVAPLQIPL